MRCVRLPRRYPRLLRRYLVSSGPQGVEGRLPTYTTRNEPNLVVITDPYILYSNYVRQGLLEKDPAQVRVMKEFQKLYYRVVDYVPPQDMAIKTSLLLRKLEIRYAEEQLQTTARSEPLHRFKLLFRRDLRSQKRDLVKFMTDEEELHNLASPQGLLVNGDVGCGKSMLMDIFASTLPHHSKMRWHYNNFILWVFEEIHNIQHERMLTASAGHVNKLTMENEFILYEIAQKMISNSTVFMLDEFMLPDIASAQIVRILFTYYFKLGGILVATSNKLPEELYSSSFNKSRFRSFVGLLSLRCVAVDMNSEKDYRRHFALQSTSRNMVTKEEPDHEAKWRELVKRSALKLDPALPYLNKEKAITDIPHRSATLTVYNRETHIPATFGDTCYLSFEHICQGLFSLVDYITLALCYRTVIIDHIPVMTTRMKNEARRFITLLDALYEARCQLFMRCDVDETRLFFPDGDLQEDNSKVVQDEEMFAKTAMQTLNPYRPNVSSYDAAHAKEYDDSRSAINYSNIKAFTGEDEKFAYKRAVSRIQEMVGSDQWRSADRWLPVDATMRPWTVRQAKKQIATRNEGDFVPPKDLKEVLKNRLPRDLAPAYNVSLQRLSLRIAPLFTSLQHFWAVGTWTLQQHQKIKDKIARAWVAGSVRDE